MSLNTFEKEILAYGRYLERVYNLNIYDTHREFVDEYLQKERVDLNDLPQSKTIPLTLKTPKDRDAYIAQALGLLSRIIP